MISFSSVLCLTFALMAELRSDRDHLSLKVLYKNLCVAHLFLLQRIFQASVQATQVFDIVCIGLCCKALCITVSQCLIVKSCFPSSAAKPSSDLLDLQPDFSGAAGGAAAPVPPAAAGGATAWGGEWVIQAWGTWGVFCGGFNLCCYCYMYILIINNCIRNRVGNAQNGFSWSDYTLKDTEILHIAV